MEGINDSNRDIITEAAAMAFADHHLQIPDRCIRADGLFPAAGVVVGDGESLELPVVDMARLLDPEHSKVEVAWLGSACRSWGFFQLINHGVDEEVIQKMKENTVQFLELPVDDKNAVAVRPGSIEGFGHHFRSAGKLDWAESLIVKMQPFHERNLEFWPSNPPTFRDSIHKYAMEMWNLTTRLLRFMASDLGVEQETLLAAFCGKQQHLALHRYPPCRHLEKVIGISPHSDGFKLTLLLQVNDTSGLQVSKDGRWRPIRPLPVAFVINIGEILEVLSNGHYKSVFHRVVVDTERGRDTIVVFQDTCINRVVRPLPKLGEPLYHAIDRSEYSKGHVTEILSQGERDSIDKYSMEMWNLAMRLLGFMARDLGVEEETLVAAFRGKRQSMTMHHYPPCHHPEKVIGISPHSDGFGLTLLLQVNDTSGLQVSKDGRWRPVRPLPGAFVINIGEILEVLTDGHYKSVFHRMVVDAERGRATVVVFQDACINGVVKPLPEIGEPPRYRVISKSEYFKGHTAEVA